MAETTTSSDLKRSMQELLQQTAPPEWVREMVEHFQRTGGFRPQDLRRLLGDPNKGVEVSNRASLASHFARHGSGQ